MGTRRIRVGTRGIKVGMRGTRVAMWEMWVGMFGMRGIWVGMRGIRVGMWGIGVGTRGVEWNKNRKREKKFTKFNFRNIKPPYQGLMSSFSRNDPNQRYYLNGMWTCGPPVIIVNFLSSNEKIRLHFTQGC